MESAEETDLDILYSMTDEFFSRCKEEDIYGKILEIQNFIKDKTGISVDLMDKNELDAAGKYAILSETEYVKKKHTLPLST